MSTFHEDRPLFIDPIAVSDGDEVDDAGVPGWFKLFTISVLALAVYYLFTFLDGPRLTSPHNFVPGRTAYEDSVTAPSRAP